jgi:hypothetical protein
MNGSGVAIPSFDEVRTFAGLPHKAGQARRTVGLANREGAVRATTKSAFTAKRVHIAGIDDIDRTA